MPPAARIGSGVSIYNCNVGVGERGSFIKAEAYADGAIQVPFERIS